MMLIQLAADAKRQFLELLQGLPVITLNRYYDFGIMLHRAIKEEIISRSDFLYPDMYDDHLTTEGALMDYHGVHQAERRMCRMIEEGNLHYQKEQDAIFSVSDNLVRNVTGDHLRQLKNRVTLKDMLTVIKSNKYIWIVSLIYLFAALFSSIDEALFAEFCEL